MTEKTNFCLKAVTRSVKTKAKNFPYNFPFSLRLLYMALEMPTWIKAWLTYKTAYFPVSKAKYEALSGLMYRKLEVCT